MRNADEIIKEAEDTQNTQNLELYQDYDGVDNIEEWLSFFDHLLETYVFRRQSGPPNPEDVIQRGVAITYDEVLAVIGRKRYEPVAFRDIDALRAQNALIWTGIVTKQQNAAGPLPIATLMRRLALRPFDWLCALAAVAPCFDRKYERIYGYVQDDIRQSNATVGLCRALYLLIFAEEPPLLNWRCQTLLFRIEESPSGVYPGLQLKATLAFYRVLRGAADTEQLPVTLEWMRPDKAPVPMVVNKEQIAGLCKFVGGWLKQPEQEPCVIVLRGEPGSGRRFALRSVASQCATDLVLIDCGKMADKWLSSLADAVLPAVAGEALPAFVNFPAENEEAAAALAEMSRYFPLLFVISEDPWPESLSESIQILEIVFPVPGQGERQVLWKDLAAKYPLAEDVDLFFLANKYRHTAGQIDRFLRQAQWEALLQGRDEVKQRDIEQAVHKRNLRLVQDQKIRVVEPVFTWGDLVLNSEVIELMQEACQRIKHMHIVNDRWGFGKKLPYGRGLSFLFYGPPGTGKTMSAQVIAGELAMDLLKVDLSQMVSKYVGETEKNLAEVFQLACRTNGVLFFDEADALFGKRTEVKNSNDKYANVETSYLLQKIEEHEGVSILATNMLSNLDYAFRRRFTYIIHIPQPDARQRLQLWQKAFPQETPLGDDLNFSYLAEYFEISGSLIKNATVAAAYAAAAENSSVTMGHVIQGLRLELRKNGMATDDPIFTDTDFPLKK